MPPQIEASQGGHDLIRFNLRENTVSEGKKGTSVVEECGSPQVTAAAFIKENERGDGEMLTGTSVVLADEVAQTRNVGGLTSVR